jgi:hypothetical protein
MPLDATPAIDQSLSSRDLPLHAFVDNTPRTQQVVAQVIWEISLFGM